MVRPRTPATEGLSWWFTTPFCVVFGAALSGGDTGMVKLLVFWVASLLLAAGAAAEELQGSAYFDVWLDEEGRATQAVCVDETHPVLIDPLRKWIFEQNFRHAAVDGRPVPSTTSVWVSYSLAEVDSDYELLVRGYDSGPRPIERATPVYPVNALETYKEGWVNIQFTVEASGAVSNPRILDSSHKLFELAALKSIRQWRFKPETVDGRPVSTEATQRIEFEMAD